MKTGLLTGEMAGFLEVRWRTRLSKHQEDPVNIGESACPVEMTVPSHGTKKTYLSEENGGVLKNPMSNPPI